MLSTTPQGYRVAYQTNTAAGTMLEMIPDGESLDQWTEMLTVQVMRNANGYTLAGFYAGMKEAWSDMCPCGVTESRLAAMSRNVMSRSIPVPIRPCF